MENKYKLIELILKSELTDQEKQSLIAELNNNNKKGFIDKILKIVGTIKAFEYIFDFFKEP